MRWPKLAEELCSTLMIVGALGAGMAASYGRELDAGRTPDRAWWIKRLLIIPLLAIAATEATRLFGLSRSGAAFTAAMLSLGGYDTIRWIEARWLRRTLALDPSSSDPEESDGPVVRR